MIAPTARWYRVAAALALVALLGLWWPDAGSWLVAFDLVWLLALVVDVARIGSLDLAAFPVARDVPPAFSVGRAMPVTCRWTNTTSQALRIHVREAPPDRLSLGVAIDRDLLLPPARTIEERVDVLPVRRGRAAGGALHLRLLSPWGLAWRQGRRALPWDVTIYPSLRNAALRALPTQAQRRREAGFRAVRRLGEGRLFESLKEWVPGEEMRTVDWKATARRGKLMSRTYEDERRQHVIIAIDAGRLLTAEIDGRARLESAIDAALELAHSAVHHDDNVGVLIFADEVMQYVPPGRGRRALRQVVDALAVVEGRLVEPDYPAAFAYLAARNRKRALTVLFTDLIDRTASDALVAQAAGLRPRHVPLAVTLRDPALERIATRRAETLDDAYQRAAAEELLEARELALADLRGRGVLVLDVLPDRAARAVVDQYERLKRRAMA